MPSLPRYKRDKIFKMLMEDRSIGEIARKTEVAKSTVKRYRKELDSIVEMEISRINQS